MKKFLFYIIIFICVLKESNAQNLIPNYSFEQHSCCQGFISCVNNWFAPNYSNPDYLSLCYWEIYHDNGYSIPLNNWGYQYPHTGNAYFCIGNMIIPNWNFNYREYLSCRLQRALIKDHKYCLTFYISPLDHLDCFYDDIGAYLSVDSLTRSADSLSANQHYYLNTQVSNPIGNIITDTANWTEVSGSFIASGDEKFITLGSFRRVENMNFINYGNPDEMYMGLFIDDIYLYECNNPVLPAEAGNNQNICYGDGVQLGSTNYEYYSYSWFPKTGLSDTTSGTPLANPLVTTTYYLAQYNFADSVTMDSVTVFVSDCVYAEAGSNRSICKGDSIQIGSSNYSYNRYSWHPREGLSDTTSGQPWAKPLMTTTYYLMQYDSRDTISRDSVTISIANCDSSAINLLHIYPNPCNDYFYIEFSLFVPDNTKIYITNVLGQTIIKEAILPEEKKKVINISNLAAGIYFCRVSAGNEMIKCEKVVVVK